MKPGYIQCRFPRQEDDDGLPVPATPWENLTDDLTTETQWRALLAESPDMLRQGNTDIYRDAAGVEYRFQPLEPGKIK